MKFSAAFLLALLFCGCAPSPAQQACPQPPALQKVSGKNIFTDQQEVDLGDAMGESLAREVSLIENPTLTSHLDELGARLARYLPPNNLKFRFYLIDIPEVNAFSLSGGRIYVARKMVALTRNDDELAGVLAHEMGHIVTHQHAIYMTLILKQVLGVTQVGDRADIYDKFQRVLENGRRHPVHVSGESEGDQYVADQVALFAMARAGFSPQAYVDLWDRFNATHGKTGNWLSDVFGQTKPAQRRLRELLKSVSEMPAECARIAPSSSTDFQAWQSQIVESATGTHIESLPGLVLREKLDQPLRPDIQNLRFSPDGKFVLAQDQGGIQVLSRDPFQSLFFIDAPNADKAFFSPDSKAVVFKTPSLRVEIWDVSSQKRVSVHEMLLRVGCLQSLLSPDGQHMACLDKEFTLSLFEVATGNEIASKKNFFELRSLGFRYLLWVVLELESGNFNLKLVHYGFSPDGRYFLAGSSTDTFAYDLAAKRNADIPMSVRNLTRDEFVFVDNDRLLSINHFVPNKSPLVRFPGGRRIQEVALGGVLELFAAAHGNYVGLGPLKSSKRGFLDLSNGNIPVGFKKDAGDVYDNTVVFEEIDGRLVLGDLSSAKVLARAQLTQSRLGDDHAIAVSDDFRWLAASSGSRGALWDLSHNVRLHHVRDFTGVWFAPDDSCYVDFPKHESQERALVLLDKTGNSTVTYPLGDLLAEQEGPYVLVRTPPGDKPYVRKNWTYELRDFRAKSVIWSRHFLQDSPVVSWTTDHDAILMGWHVYSDAAHEELKQFSDLKSSAEKEDMLYELLDLRSNTTIGKLLVKTNKSSFFVTSAAVERDWAALSVSGNRVLIYSISSGKETGHVFGYSPVLSQAAGAYAVSTAEGTVGVYSLSTSQLRRSYKFPISVLYKKFSPDGKRLLVVTRDQTVYILDLTFPDEVVSDTPRPPSILSR